MQASAGPVQPAYQQMAPPQPQGEVVLFQDATVTVTNMRAIVPGVTYAMANVTSVREFIEPRPRVLVLMGLFLLASGLCCVAANAGTVGWTENVMGAALVGIYAILKPKYWVRIGTSGAEANAIWSNDPSWTRSVVAAINGAMVARG
jgi:hypothetical protein